MLAPCGQAHPSYNPDNDMSCETEQDYTLAEMARKEGARLGKVIRRDSIGCEFETAGELYRLDWTQMDRHIEAGDMVYPGTMEPGMEFTFTFDPRRA
jgi:hypothetical protein